MINNDLNNNNQPNIYKKTKRNNMHNPTNDFQPSLFYEYPHRAEKKQSLPNLNKLREYDIHWNKWSNYNSNPLVFYPNPVINSTNNINNMNTLYGPNGPNGSNGPNGPNCYNGGLPGFQKVFSNNFENQNQNQNQNYKFNNIIYNNNMKLPTNTHLIKLNNYNNNINNNNNNKVQPNMNNNIINTNNNSINNMNINNNNNKISNNDNSNNGYNNNNNNVYYNSLGNNTSLPQPLQSNQISSNQNLSKSKNNNIHIKMIKQINMNMNMNMYKYSNDHTNNNSTSINNFNDINISKIPSNESSKSSINYSFPESKNLLFNNSKTITPLRLIKSSDNIDLLKRNSFEKNTFLNDNNKNIFINYDEDIVNKSCDLCFKRPGSVELLYCHHILCDKCIQNENLYNKDGNMMKCYCGEVVCYMKYIYDNKNLKNNKKENHDNNNNNNNNNNNQNSIINNNTTTNKTNPSPTFNGNMYNILTLERIFPVPSTYLPVVKLSNIPWDLSQKDVLAFFYPLKIPAAHESPYFTQGIHIIMNRTSGKTFSDAYIEFITMEDANTAIETRNKTILKGRIVTISKSSQEELMKSLFPSWAGNYSKDKIPSNNSSVTTSPPPMNTSSVSMGTGIIYGGLNTNCAKDGCFLTRDEVSAILLVCKNYKLHFSRKCAERPFENVISIISKIPWHIPNIINTLHRDHIFELLKLSLESLKTHLSKEYINISPTLMNRLIRSGLCCPGFTDKQKNMILNFSNHECPNDIELFVYKDKNLSDKKESFTPNNSTNTDSMSSAYPSPPNSIKTISSISSQKEIKSENNHLLNNEEFTPDIFEHIYNNDRRSSNSSSIGSNSNYSCRSDNNIDTDSYYQIHSNNCTIFESSENKILSLNDNKLNSNSKSNNKDNLIINENSSSPIEYNLTENNNISTNKNNLDVNSSKNTPSSQSQNQYQKFYTPFSPMKTLNSVTTTQSIIPIKNMNPPLLPFQRNNNYSNQYHLMNNNFNSVPLLQPTPTSLSSKQLLSSLSQQQQPFNSFINTNFSFSKLNDNSTTINKENENENENESNVNFSPFITSEGLINKNLQIRQNQNTINKFEKTIISPLIVKTTSNETELKPLTMAMTMTTTPVTSPINSPILSSQPIVNPSMKILNEILNDKKDDKNNDSIKENKETETETKTKTETKNEIENENKPENEYENDFIINNNDNINTNMNINSIKTLKNIIQNLNNKCLEYDERLKEVLEYNKKLENKILELEKNADKEEKKEEKEEETAKNEDNKENN